MKFPAYWAKATVEEVDRGGHEVTASSWGWSDSSPQEAHSSAVARARQVIQALMLTRGNGRDRYSYGLPRPMREEVIETKLDDEGQQEIAITRNSYGVLVLNTARVMFIDVDFPPFGPWEELGHWFRRLFDRTRPTPQARREAETDTIIDAFFEAHPDWGARLYRTFAGMRLVVTHALFDPAAESTRSLLESIGSDPLYVRMCRDQSCFRARLTPKPWRCLHSANRTTWPHQTDEEQAAFDRWLSEYERCQSEYATCRWVGERGSGAVHPEVERAVEIHDRMTRCHEDLPLA